MKLSVSTLGLAAIALAGSIQDRQEEGQAMRVVLQVNKALSQVSVVASNADRSEVYGEACSPKLESGIFADHPISFDVDDNGLGKVTVGSHEYVVHSNPEISGGVSCGSLSSDSEVLITCSITVPHSLKLRALAKGDLTPCFALPLALDAVLSGLDRGTSAPPAFSEADQAFNMTEVDIDAMTLSKRQFGCSQWTPSTERVGNGNPHQNPFHAQLSGNLDCGDGECTVSAFGYKSRTIEFRISQGARLTAWITGGFRVTQEVATGNSYKCKGERNQRVCVWKKVEQTAYTVQNVLLPPCGNNVIITSEPFILWSPNAYQPDNFYCVRGKFCRGIGQGWLDTDAGQPGGPQ